MRRAFVAYVVTIVSVLCVGAFQAARPAIASASSIYAPPLNDDFPGEVLDSLPLRIAGSTTDATWQLDRGESINPCVQAAVPGEPDLVNPRGSERSSYRQTAWYTLQLASASRVSVRVTSNTPFFDPVVVVYTGDALDSLANVACNNDERGNAPNAKVSFDAEAGVPYRIQIHGSFQQWSSYGDYTLELAAEAPSDCVVTGIHTLRYSSTLAEMSAVQTGCETYLFWVQTPDGTVVAGRNWDWRPFWTWDATGFPEGDYVVGMFARSSGSAADYDSAATLPFKVGRLRFIP